jgi:hypothetical protein
MDSRPSSHLQPAAVPRWLSWRLLPPALGLLVYALLLAHFMGAYAGGSDQSGYLNEARLLAHGHVTIPMRLVPDPRPETLPMYTHVPLGFIPNADHVTLTPTYPVGLPLLILAVAEVFGWELAPALTMGAHALLGLWLIYRLARAAGLARGWAWLAALLLAASPLFFFASVQVMSDVPAMVWVTAAVFGAWRSRERAWLAVPAGMALAIAVLVRPTNLLAIAPIAVALGLAPRRWLLLFLGGLPGAAFLAGFNLAAYGHAITTGYGSVGFEFSPAYLPGALVHYATWLPVLLTPIALLALGLPATRHVWPRPGGLLAAWGLVYPTFYLFYSHTHDEWWYLRFLLPAFPPILVAGLLVAQRLAARLKLAPRVWWLAPAAVAILLHGAVWSRHLHALTIGRSEGIYVETAEWMRAHLPANATVAAMETTGALFYYTDFTLVRWDMIAPADFQRIVGVCAVADRPVYAALYPYEIDEWHAFRDHLPGHWTQVGAVHQVSIWRLESLDTKW